MRAKANKERTNDERCFHTDCRFRGAAMHTITEGQGKVAPVSVRETRPTLNEEPRLGVAT
jgi:hypothetical protein